MADKLQDVYFVGNEIRAKISMARINANMQKAQYWLDSEVMTDMTPFIPFQTGNFRQRLQVTNQSFAGTGTVFAAIPPYGRFLYNGLVMVDPLTGSPWARKGAKKVVTSTPLQFSSPTAEARWFEVAKDANLQKWVNGVKKIVGEK